jgi:phosphoglycerate dehydrogenase-like enzyme
MGYYMDELASLPNVIIANKSAGATSKMVNRRATKVIENIIKFLGS